MTTKAETGAETVERIGAYRIVRRLATGGTSDVLLAKAEGPHGFERTVVLKVLLSHFGKDDDVAKMFAREASAYARLSHPAIVRLFDFFAVPNAADANQKKGNQLVMVLEYVDGPPLARLKSMAKAIGKELDDKASIYIATCIFDALAAAHSAVDDAQIPAPVIHRDVNPSNVLVPWDAFPKLADFGVAKVTGLGHHSVVGMIKGTYGYMAPEQVTGDGAITPRADVYAAGIILWELLTRRRAFQRGALPEIEALRAMAEPRLPALESIRSDVDRTIRDALRRALEPRAEKRKITAEEMVSVLSAIVPQEQGRERLVSLLGLVRNDARAASAHASLAPPPMAPAAPGSSAKELLPDVVIPGAPKMAPDFAIPTISGVGPKAAPPRPSSARMPVAPPAHPSSAKLPAATPSSAKLPAATSSAKLPAAGSAAAASTAAASTAAASSGRLMTSSPSSDKMLAAAFNEKETPVAPAVTIPPTPREETNVREILSLPTRPMMPAVVAPPPPPKRPSSRPMPAVVPGQLPPVEAPRPKSAAARLGDSMPPEPLAADAQPTRRLSGLLEGLGDSIVPQGPALSKAPDSQRGAMKDLTGGLGLRDAIDQILKVPQSQGRVPVATPVANAANTSSGAAPDSSEPKPQTRETTRVPPSMTSTLIGLIPPAPAPLTSSMPPASGPDSEKPAHQAPTAPPSAEAAAVAASEDVDPTKATAKNKRAVIDDDFPNANDEDEEPREKTVIMDPVSPRPPPAGRGNTLAMDASPVRPSQNGMPAAQVPTAALPTPRHTPSPMMAVQVPTNRPPPVISFPPGWDAEGQMQTPTSLPPPAAKKASSMGAVAIALVGVIGISIAGTIAFVRSQGQKTPAEVPTYEPPPHPVPSIAASGAPQTPVTPASVAVPPPVVSASASAVPTPSSSVATPSEPVPEGMGRIETTNTAPGRRIFVDDKVAGQTPEAVTLKCGAHKVKLGSSGVPQEINVPCGGAIAVADVKPEPGKAPEAPKAPAPAAPVPDMPAN